MMVAIDPIEALLWTFRKDEKDVVNLYNSLSDVMRLATGGDMLNFGYWEETTKGPLEAQIELCKTFGLLADLQTAKSVVDVGGGFSAPSIQWKLQYDFLEITCLNINLNQLKQSSKIIKKTLTNRRDDFIDGINLLNATSTSLPFANESVDRVLALESAHHFKLLENFLSESHRILKNEGILALAMPVVNEKKILMVKLGILSMTWASQHYTVDHIESSLANSGFNLLEMKKIGSMVYQPLVDYYIENRDSLKNKILSKYPSYVEKILFKSLVKMKQVSKTNVIDYLLIKCSKK